MDLGALRRQFGGHIDKNKGDNSGDDVLSGQSARGRPDRRLAAPLIMRAELGAASLIGPNSLVVIYRVWEANNQRAEMSNSCSCAQLSL